MPTRSLSQLWAALWLAVVYQAAGLRIYQGREGRQWWLFEHIDGGKVWEQAVKEEGLDPSTISEFGRRVPKYPRSVVEGILRLNASKIRNYNFMGTYFWESPPGTMAGPFEVPKDAMQRNRHWVIDAARRYFGPGDFFFITDYRTRGKNTTWEPLGDFDNTTARVRPRNDVFPGIFASTAYLQTMRQSRFTLCPAGEEPWSTRLFEAVLVGSLPVVRSRYDDMCAYANGNIKPLQHVYDLYQTLSIDRLDELPAQAQASSLYRQDWVDENLRTFIKYQTFMEGDNQPQGAAQSSPMPACEGRLLPPGRSGRGRKVLLVLVGLFRSIEAQWPLLKRDLVDPQTQAGYTFELVVHTSTADSDVGDAVGALRRLLSPWDATVVDRVDNCTMLTPNMQPGERCVHADLPGTRHISCGTMHFASRAVDALRPHMHDSDLDKVLVIRSDRHLVPDPPPKWSHVAPGYAGPVGTMPVPAGWSFSFGDACREHPGVNIVGSAQITNGFAADHDPDWAWLLCDPSRLDLFVEALASAGLPCSPGCRPPYAAAPSKAGKSWLRCDGGWCRSAEVLDGKIEFGTLKGYALASI